MKNINSSDFIQDVLTQNKSSIVLFYDDKQKPSSFNFFEVLQEYNNNSSDLPIFLFNTSSEKNLDLANNLGIEHSPTLIIFKNGSINRWLEPSKQSLTKHSVFKFLGNPSFYGIDKEKSSHINNLFSKKKKKL